MTIAPAQLEQHRTALTGHCYRMMGSAVDADDAVQETMVRAWRSLDRFDGRSSLRTWLYRIATNVCLDLLAQRARRARPMESTPAGTVDDPLTTMPRTHWLEPVPDARAVPADAHPSELIILRPSLHLAFLAALQPLPPKHRRLRLALLRPVPGRWIRGRLPAMGPHRPRAVGRPHHGLELVPGYVDAVPEVRLASASSRVATCRRTLPTLLRTDDFDRSPGSNLRTSSKGGSQWHRERQCGRVGS